uniref:V-type proton ATPase subunit G n=1 Tax=Panstrongylus lignarius TaxID=156445 RepID=A0A224Y156_9HEMI
MASQTQGIQQLLAAEKRAADKVADAKKRKARRLKQAKEQAQQEIDKYKQDREKQFREFEAKHVGSRVDVAARIEAATRQKIEELNKAVSVNKEECRIGRLSNRWTSCQQTKTGVQNCAFISV